MASSMKTEFKKFVKPLTEVNSIDIKIKIKIKIK